MNRIHLNVLLFSKNLTFVIYKYFIITSYVSFIYLRKIGSYVRYKDYFYVYQGVEPQTIKCCAFYDDHHKFLHPCPGSVSYRLMSYSFPDLLG